MTSQHVVRIFWGERLLDQRVCAAGAQLTLDANLRAEWLTAERPERVAADPWSQLRDFAVPVAMMAMLVGALVMAVIPTHDAEWFNGSSLALDDVRGGEAKLGRATAQVQVASAQRSQHGEAKVTRSREAILTVDAPTKDAPPIAPKEAAKKLVDQLFAGMGQLTKKSPQLDAAIGSLAVGTTFASSDTGLELRGQSGGGFGPVKVANLGSIGGIGTLPTRGRGGGESAYGSGVGLIAGRRSQVIIDIIAPAVVIGGLDKELISKVMKLHASEIRYCYENALVSDPELEGRLAVRFVISATGDVAMAEVTDSLGNAELDGCITSRLRRWQFPSTPGGGVVVVNYPWQFSHRS